MSDKTRELFRALIDYVETFEPTERYRGLLFWNAGDPVRRRVNVTSQFMQAVEKGDYVLGVLPHESENEWTMDKFKQILDRFAVRFHLEDVNVSALESENFDGTACVALRHRLFSEVVLRVAALKKSKSPRKNTVFLVDHTGRCMSALESKRVKVFTFDMLTNCESMQDWKTHLRPKQRSKRKIQK